ncbi:MAG: bifunctional phosphoribosyl-AMP cyclohydrolase/phosphoribosyl-ATP diphosphatase HisIE [Candidatus Marinimicrobia bacterium]|nr:bifunctional phosphoribosyl-AMP cyclohydrolase/phosphoribosyl-ATP diphosphatase HisIE [Candidatus Neomarinimicrobiota bacterium]
MNIDFKKGKGLVPAIVQDERSNKVLMLGYMNEEAYKKTLETKKVTFYSRSRETIWTKGESSGNFLELVSISVDCDGDTLLVKAIPEGPVCHTGDDTCFGDTNQDFAYFINELEKIIADRKENPSSSSYTNKLFEKGISRIAQKVGEEATEVVIEAMANNKELLTEEISDLIYHVLVLMAARDISLDDINLTLMNRHKK